MTGPQMVTAFKFGLDKIDSLSYPNFTDTETYLLLNQGQDRYVKQRYGITNTKRQSFEETQKRTDDLKALVVNAVISPSASSSDNKPNGRFYVLPSTAGSEYWFAVNEEVGLVYKPCNSALKTTTSTIVADAYYIVTSGSVTYNSVVYTATSSFIGVTGFPNFTGTGVVYSATLTRVPVEAIGHDQYNNVIYDPFNKPDKDEVIRLMEAGQVELITGSSEHVLGSYYLRYIKKPRAFSASVDSILSEHTHSEIVASAIQIALEGIESKRQNTYDKIATTNE